jgi:hypothetical protein
MIAFQREAAAIPDEAKAILTFTSTHCTPVREEVWRGRMLLRLPENAESFCRRFLSGVAVGHLRHRSFVCGYRVANMAEGLVLLRLPQRLGRVGFDPRRLRGSRER